jgi:hypothetical protein
LRSRLWSTGDKDLDQTLYETEVEKYAALSTLLAVAAKTIIEKRGLTVRTCLLARILTSASDQTDRIAAAIDESFETAAWSTRNLFELTCLYEYVRSSDEHLEAWLSEYWKDKVEIFEGLRDLALIIGDDIARHDVKWASEQIELVEKEAEQARASIPRSRLRVRAIAEAQEWQSEYDALYSIYSKWVHPTPWRLVSGALERHLLEGPIGMILAGRSRAYAARLLDCAAEDCAAETGEEPDGIFDRPLSEIPEEYEVFGQREASLMREMDEALKAYRAATRQGGDKG